MIRWLRWQRRVFVNTLSQVQVLRFFLFHIDESLRNYSILCFLGIENDENSVYYKKSFSRYLALVIVSVCLVIKVNLTEQPEQAIRLKLNLELTSIRLIARQNM